MDRKIEKKLFYKKYQFWSYAGGGILFLYLIINIFNDSGSKLNVDEKKITISTVAEGDFQEYIPVSGTVLPRTTFYLDAIMGGVVEYRYVEEGAMLQKGDKILRLSNTSIQLSTLQQETYAFQQINDARNIHLQIEQNSINLQNTLVNAEYNFINARQIYDRQSVLWEKNLISHQEFEEIENNYHRNEMAYKLAYKNFVRDSLLKEAQLSQISSSINRLEKNLELIRTNIDNLTVRAPIKGQLTSLDAETGQSKSPGQQLGQIDALDGFIIKAEIDEFYISRINKGLIGKTDIDGNSYKLTIVKIYPGVKEGKFQVDMEFNGSTPYGMRRGQTLQIRLQLSDRIKAILLPRGGFYLKTGGRWIFVIDESKLLATKQLIQLGRQNPDYFEVVSGLKPGDKVVTSSYDNFGDVNELAIN